MTETRLDTAICLHDGRQPALAAYGGPVGAPLVMFHFLPESVFHLVSDAGHPWLCENPSANLAAVAASGTYRPVSRTSRFDPMTAARPVPALATGGTQA